MSLAIPQSGTRIGSSTIAVTFVGAPPVTVGGEALTIKQSAYIIASQTLIPGAAALTVSGTQDHP